MLAEEGLLQQSSQEFKKKRYHALNSSKEAHKMLNSIRSNTQTNMVQFDNPAEINTAKY